MVRISLPILSRVSIDQVRGFFEKHLPSRVQFTVEYSEAACFIKVPLRHAAAVNILYYAIPDYLSQPDPCEDPSSQVA